MSQRNNIPTVGLRLASMLLDHFIMTFTIAFTCFIISIPILLLKTPKINSEIHILEAGFFGLLTFSLFSLYFNKDILNGQSPAKSIVKLQIVDKDTEEAAMPLKCLVRNFTIIIWPLEIIVTLFSPCQRLGDKLANTKVVVLDETKEKMPLNRKEIMKALLAGVILLAILFLLSLTLQGVFL